MRTGAAAFTAAFEFADRLGVAIKAIHAWSAFRPPPDVTNPYLIDWDGLEAVQWQNLLDTLAPWTELHPDVEVTYLVEPEGASTHSCSMSRVHNLWSSTTEGATCWSVRCWAPRV